MTSLGNLLRQLWLELEAWRMCHLESTGIGGDEMQNKAEAQPAWLQLSAGAYLSLAIMRSVTIIRVTTTISTTTAMIASRSAS